MLRRPSTGLAWLVRPLALVAGVAIAGCGRSLPSAPTGTWEGEIANPRRPYVVSIDFGAARGQLAAGGPVEGAIAHLASTDDGLSFELKLPSETWRFEGVRHGAELRGNVTTLDGQIPFWLASLPAPAPPANRGEAWRQDLDSVLARFLRYDRSFDPEHRAAARAQIERLRDAADAMTDAQVMVELARAIASGGNAHTRLYLMRNRSELRRLPIRVWWFRDELRIVRAAPAHRDLLGCRVVDIDGIDIATAAARVRGVEAGNPSWQRYMASYFLTSPDALHAVAVARNPDRATLALSCGSGPRLVSLAAPALRRQTAPVEAWWDLAPSYPRADDLAPALSTDSAPRYLRRPSKPYWFERVPEDDALYVQVNRAQADPAEPMPAFAARLVAELERRPPRAIVVDVRFNTGGDLTVTSALADKLAAFRGRIPLFVLTGRATFSAGITLAAQCKQLADAVILGEPVGDELDSWSEGGNLVLPHSGLTVHYANAFHAYSKRPYPDREPVLDLDVDSLAPARAIEPTWDDYIAGEDPVYAAALTLIAAPGGRH
ncbi:MAG TPA: hypothetical protein VLM79_29165 [Kofleriaceae bacterium]|nr:hypothetical protein [Kofleriaceae bacterium]